MNHKEIMEADGFRIVKKKSSQYSSNRTNKKKPSAASLLNDNSVEDLSAVKIDQLKTSIQEMLEEFEFLYY